MARKPVPPMRNSPGLRLLSSIYRVYLRELQAEPTIPPGADMVLKIFPRKPSARSRQGPSSSPEPQQALGPAPAGSKASVFLSHAPRRPGCSHGHTLAGVVRLRTGQQQGKHRPRNGTLGMVARPRSSAFPAENTEMRLERRGLPGSKGHLDRGGLCRGTLAARRGWNF